MNKNGLGGQDAGFCVDSITTCVEMVKRGLGWGIVPEIGLNDFDGCVRPCGKDADVVLLDEDANVVHVFARGKQVK